MNNVTVNNAYPNFWCVNTNITTYTHNSYCEIPHNKMVLSLGFSMNASRVTIAATDGI